MDIKFKMTLALGLTLVVLCKCRGGDCLPFELLDRAYCRTNTWNGCCVFENGQGTQFRKWEPPRNEIVSAIYAARHYVRYGKRTSVAAS